MKRVSPELEISRYIYLSDYYDLKISPKSSLVIFNGTIPSCLLKLILALIHVSFKPLLQVISAGPFFDLQIPLLIPELPSSGTMGSWTDWLAGNLFTLKIPKSDYFPQCSSLISHVQKQKTVRLGKYEGRGKVEPEKGG